MLDLTLDVDTYDELIHEVESKYSGTIFDGIDQLYIDYEAVLRPLFERRDETTPDAFIGSEESLIKEGLDIDEEVIEEIIEDDEFNLKEFMRFFYDFTGFLHSRIESRAETWEDVAYGLYVYPREFEDLSEAEAVDAFTESIEEQRENQVQQLRDVADELEGSDDEQADFLRKLMPPEQLRTQANALEKSSLLEYVTHGFKQTQETAREHLESIEYFDGSEPEVGEYLVFQSSPGENKVAKAEDYDFEFTTDTVYNIIVKVTGKETVEKEGGLFEVTEYSYDVIAYDDEILELYPQQYIVTGGGGEYMISPSKQNEYEKYESNPIGDVPMKTTRRTTGD